ncbi:MAG TPA: SUMF1/EgtB/PvdO family nonheme iron enzyme [Methylomirabilota bacterium]|nr:SUMF1/EgtB/PvdO family nonheme iron enzyme [Methylomirabilota bacterium]
MKLRCVLTMLAIVLGPALPSAADADGIMLVPAGAFWMGRDDGPPEQAPLHRVFVRDFWIDRHKVTNAEFAQFLNAQGAVSPEGERRFDADDEDARIHQANVGPPPHPMYGQPVRWMADPGFERRPAVEVTWFGARDYCRWKGRRLPTEAEWEKAARGDDKRPYPWGFAPPSPERAVYGRRYNATEPADARPAGRSPYGVEDMLGNLREWTSTILRPYPYRHDDGREGLTGEGRGVRSRRADAEPQAERARGEPVRVGAPVSVVVRGASHDDPAGELSVTLRRSYDRRGAAAGHHHVGFRCATSEDLGGR